MKRIPIIDFVRFGSILIVMSNHFFPRSIVQSIDSPVIRKIILNVFLDGAHGVTYFFVVSGFLITQLLVAGANDFSGVNLGSFYVKRAARILPLLVAVVLVALFLKQYQTLLDPRIQKYHIWDNEQGFGWLFWGSLFTFNFNWYLMVYYAGVGFQWRVFWTLAVEEQFYFFYPLIVKTLRNRHKVFIFLIGVVLFSLVFRYMAQFYFDPDDKWMPLASFSVFDQIAVGGIFYFLDEKFGYWLEARRKTSLSLMLFGIICCFYVCYSASMQSRNYFIYVPTLVAASCALVILGGLHIPALFSKTAQILSWPGKLSYGSYLWYTSVMFLIMPVLVSLGGVLGLIYLISTVFFFAFLSYRYFEVPVNRRIRAWFDLKPSPSE